MRNILVPKPKGDSLAGQLISLYKSLEGLSPREIVRFDLSQLTFACPLLVLPFCAYLNTTKSEYSLGENNAVASYLDAISFPKGIDSISSFRAKIQKEKSYVPISVLMRERPPERERLEALFMGMIYKTMQTIEGARNAVFYPITEIVTNIFEHSKQDQGFVFGQFYPTKNHLEICIVDRGRGLAMAYKEEKGLRLSDQEAIAEVMRGNSTKPNTDRGYGIRTSKKVVCEGLGGEFVLVSGSSALLASQSKEQLVSLTNFYWQGVIVAYRIPKPTNPIDISPYLE